MHALVLVLLSAAPPQLAEEAAAREAALRRELGAEFTVVIELPFVVVGNEAPAKVKERARDIVRRTAQLLLADFFTQAPDHLEEVWLFKDAPTYEQASRQRFKTEPDTPYGYYLSSRHALVMNIRPGYGTLTHELVHPFMHQAWPDAPAWLNEGLASLFEQPYERDAHLKGGVNWRLPGLKGALKRKQVPSFRALTQLDANGFYDDDTGSHYAAARYLCYWLQEKGLLVKFVKRAIADQAADPTGFDALIEVLGQDPDSLRPEWERFVLDLERHRS